MRASTILCGLLSVAGFTYARSWQHVGKKSKTPAPLKLQRDYLATRQVPEPKFANDNTTSE